ncbi:MULTISPECIES: F0F1 ATP synthase subunit epsilon [Vogesella]|jgi:F-type H+-transporting ATPase subunit epsilon|uniref:ATP synthase epsilon chain n=3 Tax=Vogesella TaxID=57739 RepID=A0A495AXB0_VOGIN|nr:MULTISPECIES: F0F1 ATP synthase subunit epsilon [Vogesella]KMJ52144.1 ATP synthase subunit epsilon [Vogesella sp. EB]MCQ4145882.1 F0F1 ATP synthase subunit epsilon [Vogesella sp. AC12]MDC7691757.1 F0F1 ATP synthase subunit epsilon [Vogesella indigofera]MDC7698808.1 F0F1 ATP synthase subunit epsilon [Vogesella indigofera]MDC7702398.1 F0F1 ATP synthase subunit epsilon [Vogesella indigofera]
MAKMHVEVVSTEQQIYSGEAEFLVAPAQEGEIGIYPRHVPLLTRIKPGLLRLTVPGSKEEVLVAVSGGMMEVQPNHITVLADTAIRGEDLDEARAAEAKRTAEDALKHAASDQDTAKAQAALASAIAQLKALEYLRKRVH